MKGAELTIVEPIPASGAFEGIEAADAWPLEDIFSDSGLDFEISTIQLKHPL